MSTHASIILQVNGDQYKSIYLHFDGYPSHAFTILNEHYADRSKVEQLMELGNISFLGPSIECPPGHSFDTPVDGHSVFYGRDRNEKNQEAYTSYWLKEHINQEYNYLFTINDKWVRVI